MIGAHIPLALLLHSHVVLRAVTASTCRQSCIEDSVVQDEVTLLQVHLKHQEHADRTKVMFNFRSKECDAMLPLWRQAAKQLGLTGWSEDSACYFLHGFYGRLSAPPEKYDLPDTKLTYIPIFKCASAGFTCNIQHSYPLQHYNPHGSLSNSLSFTFVRDPLTRFVSGYSEINNRLELFHNHSENICGDEVRTYEAYELSSSDRALAFIKDILTGNLKRECWVNWHVFSMLAPMRDYNHHVGSMGFVGRLETFDKDWAHLKSLANASLPAWDSECGSHSQSDARSGYAPREAMKGIILPQLSSNLMTKHAMRHLLARQRNVSLLLHCSILLPDYECLGYVNPIGKEECIEAGYASSVQTWDVAITKLRLALCPQIEALSLLP